MSRWWKAANCAPSCRLTLRFAGQQNLSKSGVDFGYSYLFRNYLHTQLNETTAGMSGWDSEYSLPLQPGSHWALAFDGAGYYSDVSESTPPLPACRFNCSASPEESTQIYFTMIGPRYETAVGRSAVELRALAGAMFANGQVLPQTTSNVRAIFGAGGAWEYPAGRHLAWRFGFDWIYGGFKSNDTNQVTQIARLIRKMAGSACGVPVEPERNRKYRLFS